MASKVTATDMETYVPGSPAERFKHFWGTSPDETHNRHRMVFFLIVIFLIGIAYEMYFDCGNERVSLVKSFSTTITWLVGIYVGGSVAAKFVK